MSTCVNDQLLQSIFRWASASWERMGRMSRWKSGDRVATLIAATFFFHTLSAFAERCKMRQSGDWSISQNGGGSKEQKHLQVCQRFWLRLASYCCHFMISDVYHSLHLLRMGCAPPRRGSGAPLEEGQQLWPRESEQSIAWKNRNETNRIGRRTKRSLWESQTVFGESWAYPPYVRLLL